MTKKASRPRCPKYGCRSFASPAGTGLCSYHNWQFTAEGERPPSLPQFPEERTS
jgi:hypothetical protein